MEKGFAYAFLDKSEIFYTNWIPLSISGTLPGSLLPNWDEKKALMKPIGAQEVLAVKKRLQ